ncbi:MAG: pyrimidine 5'-nucleotidase, partial [Rhodospirillales bacterium]|nr:pyrimidine 5'-nucleotidase [Rhodospirillales bacterium]
MIPLDLRPAASGLPSWVFDLDNTLYPASCSLFPQIDQRMKRFIAEALGIDPDQAYRLQKEYYRAYGTTLRGLMVVHGLSPDTFLEFVHEIDHACLIPSARLDAALSALPGRKLVFTNGSEKHAVAVLDRLGLSRHFEGIFDIKAAGYIPKPDPEAYATLLKAHALEARGATMFEDLHRNLKPAHALGMTTVWVRDDTHCHAPPGEEPSTFDHVHHITEDLAGWLDAAAASRAESRAAPG